MPEGAVPKDGPSAGITLTTALASLVTGKAVSPDYAMTGEVSLRGGILPIGGLPEKLMAAQRAGITKVLIPFDNADDLEDVAGEKGQRRSEVIARIKSDLSLNGNYEKQKPIAGILISSTNLSFRFRHGLFYSLKIRQINRNLFI